MDILQEILGHAGAAALEKACQRRPELRPLLVPRAILAWLQAQDRLQGLGLTMDLTKRDGGWYGHLQGQELVAANDFQAAAGIAVALGYSELELDPGIRVQILRTLGESLDNLAKAEQQTKSKKKPRLPMRKVDLPGKTAIPRAAAPPQGPTPGKKQPRRNLPGLSVGKSEAQKACSRCRQPLFAGPVFTACSCFPLLAKSVTCSAYPDGYILDFEPDVPAETREALRKRFYA